MPNTVYENVVIGNKAAEILTTKVDLNSYVTIDEDLVEQAGMKKTVHTYTSTGNVEDLAQGVGNSGDIAVSFSAKDYTVVTTQGRFQYFDEQAMKDPKVVEVGVTNSAKEMINDFSAKAIAEYEKATLATTPVAWSFDAVVDAIGQMELEDETGLFLLISPKDKAAFRKALGDDLKYAESFARTGYIGTVCGVPVIWSKAVPAGKGYLATKEAVTLFMKKDTEVEQERDANLRNNVVYIRKVSVVALTDATKVVKITITPGA